MKIYIIAFALILIVVLLTIFSGRTEAATPNPFDDRFVTCKASRYTTILVDKMTGVCYIWRKEGYGAGMTVLVDTDGTPLLYEKAWMQSFGGEK